MNDRIVYKNEDHEILALTLQGARRSDEKELITELVNDLRKEGLLPFDYGYDSRRCTMCGKGDSDGEVEIVWDEALHTNIHSMCIKSAQAFLAGTEKES